jgi:hypothetical protein
MISGQEFLRDLKEALKIERKHTQLFDQFTATFQPETIVSWENLINAWKTDRSHPNPYLESCPCKSLFFLLPFNILVVVGHCSAWQLRV